MYYYFTLLCTSLVPFALQMVFIEKIHNLPMIVSIPCFAVMMLYGYVITTIKHPQKPDSIMCIYLPVIMPLLWYMICIVLFNIFNLSYNIFADALLGVITFSMFGLFADIPGLDFWYSMQLINLLYFMILIGGFAAGERLSALRTKTKRQFFGKYGKIILKVYLVIIFVYLLSDFFISFAANFIKNGE